MKKFLHFVPTHLLVFLIIGILVGYYIAFPIFLIFYILFVAIMLLIFVYFFIKNKPQHSIYFSIIIYIISLSIGSLNITLHHELNNKKHYYHLIEHEADLNSTYLLEVEIRKELKTGFKQHKYIAKVLSVNHKTTMGKVLLSIQTDTLIKVFKVDQRLLFYAQFKPIEAPKNPYYFDYKRYLKNQQVHHQLLISQSNISLLPTTGNSIAGWASALIYNINQKLAPYKIAKEELAVINAFLLGDRHDISKDLMESYINAGAVHIMAISGMHFGILFLILNSLLKPFERIKNGKIWKMVIIIIFLWIYAFIAGLSGSVVRAVLMFSIIAFAMHLQKIFNIFYTLIVSLFILLLINPFFLFEVGFQLSYAAVFSIVIFQPIMQKFWNPKNWILRFYWDIFTVSIAAQIGVLPISLYYFHQFPGLFMLTNFIIIPFLGLILIGGLLVFTLALLNALPSTLLFSYVKIIYWMNEIVRWIAAQESFLITEIPFNGWMLLAFLAIIFSLLLYLKQQTYQHLKVLLLAVIGFQMILFYTKWQSEKTYELIVFHKNKQSIIGEKTGDKLLIYTNMASNTIQNTPFLNSYKIGKSIDSIIFKPTKNVFYFQHKWVVIIDKSVIYKLDSIKPNILILQDSPKINLNRLLETIKPQLIIADGSNYSSYVKLWEATCEKTKTPFHYTKQKGAYKLN